MTSTPVYSPAPGFDLRLSLLCAVADMRASLDDAARDRIAALRAGGAR